MGADSIDFSSKGDSITISTFTFAFCQKQLVSRDLLAVWSARAR